MLTLFDKADNNEEQHENDKGRCLHCFIYRTDSVIEKRNQLFGMLLCLDCHSVTD